MRCWACNGSGQVNSTQTCPQCHGNGSYTNHRLEFVPCPQCGGRRTVSVRMLCATCRGTGVLPDPQPAVQTLQPPIPTRPVSPDRALGRLAGSWRAGADSKYEFVKQKGGYRVTAFNPSGTMVGEGDAQAIGNELVLTINTQAGSVTFDMQINGERLEGSARDLSTLRLILDRE